MKKKILGILIVIALMLGSIGLMTGCGGGGDDITDPQPQYTGAYSHYDSSRSMYVYLILSEDGEFYYSDATMPSIYVGDYTYNANKTKLTLSCFNLAKLSKDYDVEVNNNVVTIKGMYNAPAYHSEMVDLVYDDENEFEQTAVTLMTYYELYDESKNVNLKSDKTYTFAIKIGAATVTSSGTYTQAESSGTTTYTLTATSTGDSGTVYTIVDNGTTVTFKKTGGDNISLTAISIENMVSFMDLEGETDNDKLIELSLYDDGRCLLIYDGDVEGIGAWVYEDILYYTYVVGGEYTITVSSIEFTIAKNAMYGETVYHGDIEINGKTANLEQAVVILEFFGTGYYGYFDFTVTIYSNLKAIAIVPGYLNEVGKVAYDDSEDEYTGTFSGNVFTVAWDSATGSYKGTFSNGIGGTVDCIQKVAEFALNGIANIGSEAADSDIMVTFYNDGTVLIIGDFDLATYQFSLTGTVGTYEIDDVSGEITFEADINGLKQCTLVPDAEEGKYTSKENFMYMGPWVFTLVTE